MYRYLALFIVVLLTIASCQKTNDVSNIPQISSLSVKPNMVKAGSSSDTVYLSFHFKDGDADLGINTSGTVYDIYLVDSRDSDTSGYFFPDINSSVENPSTGIDGNCTVKLLAAFLIPRSTRPNGDTLRYQVFIKDRALNTSNVLVTPDIYIKP
jgi:hypothetical protein